jgi:hypothetical protein
MVKTNGYAYIAVELLLRFLKPASHAPGNLDQRAGFLVFLSVQGLECRG